jgi:tyrosinase
MTDFATVWDETHDLLSVPIAQVERRLFAAAAEKAIAPRPFFSEFVPEDVEAALAEAEELMRIADSRPGADGLQTAVERFRQRRQEENADLIQYAFLVFLTHHPKGRLLSGAVPPLDVRAPERVAPSTAAPAGLAAANQGGGVLPQPDGLEWFREDPFANEHHDHWHIVYPISGIPDGKGGRKVKERHGELFLYMHRQMLARYDAERFYQGLPRTVPFGDFREAIAEGYDPGPVVGKNFSRREAGKSLQSLYIPGWILPPSYTISDQEVRRDRMLRAVGTGRFDHAEPGVPVTVDTLGATVEPSIATLTPGTGPGRFTSYYGNYHGMGHIMSALINGPTRPPGPDNKPGVIVDTATAIRDPLFWRWHKHIDNLYFAWQERQPPYDFADGPYLRMRKTLSPAKPPVANSTDLILSFLDTIPKGDQLDLQAFGERTFGGSHWDEDFAKGDITTEHLETAMAHRTIRLSDGTEMEVEHLVHREFVYFFRLENLVRRHTTVALRVFLVPKDLAEDRRAWIEMDKFLVELPPLARTVVARRGSDSSVNRKPAAMEPQPIGRKPERPFLPDGSINPKWDDRYNYCTCGWPYNLLVPRGTEAGAAFRLLVVATDWELDRIGPDGCCGSLSFCGALDRYPDRRPMGYPFDAPFAAPIADTVMRLGQMAFRDITIQRIGLPAAGEKEP